MPGTLDFEELVDDHAVVDGEAGGLCEGEPRAHPDTDDDEVGIDLRSVHKANRLLADLDDRGLEVKDNAVLLVEALDEFA